MDIDTDKIDEVVLAPLYLGLHDGARAWKSFDWKAMGRLHAKGYIGDPVSKAKSVLFTEDGSSARFASSSVEGDELGNTWIVDFRHYLMPTGAVEEPAKRHTNSAESPNPLPHTR